MFTVQETARFLVVATDELAGSELIEELSSRLSSAPSAEVMVIAPAVEKTAFRHALGDADSASRDAKLRLQASLDELSRAGIRALGEVGESDPVLAAQDALRQFIADEVLIVAHAESEARWFEDRLFERAQEELRPAVRMIAVRHEEGDPAPHVAGVEESGTGRRPAPGVEPESRRSPSLPHSALIGILVAVVFAIAVIAAITLLG